MNTNPSRSARSAQAGPRRSPSAAGKRAAPRPTVQLADAPSEDGSLSLVTDSGELVQATPAPVVESLRYMLGRIRLGDGVELPERLGLTSAISGEGVTFVTRAMALVLANDASRRVCLVDLNWWAPTPWPAPAGQVGIADVIRGSEALEDALVTTGNPGLSVLPAGQATVGERPIFANSTELDKLLVELSETFDHVLVDLPAVRLTSEALRLAEASRTVAFVVNQGVTPEDQLKAAIDDFQRVPLLGVILNRASTKIPKFIRRRIPGATAPVG